MTVWWIVPGYVLVFTLVPRFTLSLRALYARDVQERRGSRLGTAFGLTSTRHSVIEIAMSYTESGQDEGSEGTEEIAMDEEEIWNAGRAA